MLQFKVQYQDVYAQHITCDVLRVRDIEEAINVVVDYCLAHSTTWGCEISNAGGFVLRIQFNQARKPLSDLRRITLTKYSRSRARTNHQLNLFAV